MPPFDALLPPDMAEKAEAVGAAKAAMPTRQVLLLAVLAGAFIALGAMFATTTSVGVAAQLSWGVSRIVAGLTFSLGLILVVVAGAELFTGNNLLVMAWASGRVPTAQLFRNWGLVYLGNLLGAVLTAVLVFQSGIHENGNGAVGAGAIAIATQKCQLDYWPALFRGVLCNGLVCLAVWLSFSARTTTDRILAVIGPVTAFVACGFEHCVANMYFIPYGILVAEESRYASGTGLGWSGFLGNLLPVTMGNIIGGAGLVGLIYWFAYRNRGAGSAGGE